MRYVLTHGWRFLFIFLEICLYIRLVRLISSCNPRMELTRLEQHFFLRSHFQRVGQFALPDRGRSYPSQLATVQFQARSNIDDEEDEVSDTQLKPIRSRDDSASLRSAKAPTSPAFQVQTANTGDQPKSVFRIFSHRRAHTPKGDSGMASVERILLLNAYPLLYIILWIPGLANRIVEASGHTSTVTQVLQLSTQFVGLANALTFGWNEAIARQLREKFGKRRPGLSSVIV